VAWSKDRHGGGEPWREGARDADAARGEQGGGGWPPPGLAQERVAVADLLPSPPQDARRAAGHRAADLLPAAAVAQEEAVQLLIVAGSEGAVVQVVSKVFSPPITALLGGAPGHLARHAAPVVAGALLLQAGEEALQARILLRGPRRRGPDAEDAPRTPRLDDQDAPHRGHVFSIEWMDDQLRVRLTHSKQEAGQCVFIAVHSVRVRL
jgi:hypothetical protein